MSIINLSHTLSLSLSLSLYTFAWRRYDDMCVLCVHGWQGKLYQRANYFTSRNPVSNAGFRISKAPSTAHGCVQRPNYLDMTYPSKRIGTSWTVSHIEHNSESVLHRNYSPLDSLLLALAFRYHLVWRRHENISPCTGNRVSRCISYDWPGIWR